MRPPHGRKERGIDCAMTPPLDTHDLLLRSKQGDMDAFRLVVEHYQGYASSLAIRMLCDTDEADDVVQDAFIRVWRHLSNYDTGSKFTTWLYTIVTNLCFDHLRARKRSREVFVPADGKILNSVPSGEKERRTRGGMAFRSRYRGSDGGNAGDGSSVSPSSQVRRHRPSM